MKPLLYVVVTCLLIASCSGPTYNYGDSTTRVLPTGGAEVNLDGFVGSATEAKVRLERGGRDVKSRWDSQTPEYAEVKQLYTVAAGRFDQLSTAIGNDIKAGRIELSPATETAQNNAQSAVAAFEDYRDQVDGKTRSFLPAVSIVLGYINQFMTAMRTVEAQKREAMVRQIQDDLRITPFEQL